MTENIHKQSSVNYYQQIVSVDFYLFLLSRLCDNDFTGMKGQILTVQFSWLKI